MMILIQDVQHALLVIHIEETQCRMRYETNPDMLKSLQLELNHYDDRIFAYEGNLQNLMIEHEEFRNDILYEMQNIEFYYMIITIDSLYKP